MLHLHNIISGIWAIDQMYARQYYPMIASWIKGERMEAHSDQGQKKDAFVRVAVKGTTAYEVSDYGEAVSPDDAPEGSVAIISIMGAITKHDQFCGPQGMLTKSSLLRRCYANNNIIGVILHLETGGGEGHASRLMAEAIRERNKPVIAFADDFCASAGMMIAAACDRIIASNELTRLGSIGTYMTIADDTKYWEDLGVRWIEVYADASKDKNQDYYKALKGDLSGIKVLVNTFNDHFLAGVRSDRGEVAAKNEKEWSTGKMFFAQEAISIGLADEIGTLEDVVNSFNT
jgi:ClpP class serine protease